MQHISEVCCPALLLCLYALLDTNGQKLCTFPFTFRLWRRSHHSCLWFYRLQQLSWSDVSFSAHRDTKIKQSWQQTVDKSEKMDGYLSVWLCYLSLNVIRVWVCLISVMTSLHICYKDWHHWRNLWTNASESRAWFYEWMVDIQVRPAGWLKTGGEKISTYSMIHHNKVLGRGWWCHRWWWGSHLWVREEKEEEEMEEEEEEEEEDKEERWVKKKKDCMGRWGTCCVWPMVTGNAGLWMTHHCFTNFTHTHTHTHTHRIHRDAYGMHHHTHTHTQI